MFKKSLCVNNENIQDLTSVKDAIDLLLFFTEVLANKQLIAVMYITINSDFGHFKRNVSLNLIPIAELY